MLITWINTLAVQFSPGRVDGPEIVGTIFVVLLVLVFLGGVGMMFVGFFNFTEDIKESLRRWFRE